MRTKIVQARTRGRTLDQLAADFGGERQLRLGEAQTLLARPDRWLPALTEEAERHSILRAFAALVEMVKADPEATLEQLKASISKRLGVSMSLSALSRTLSKLGLARKKKSLHASERDTSRRQNLRAEHAWIVEVIEPARLKFVDEMGIHIAQTPLYGRAPRGERVAYSVPSCRGENLSVLGSIDFAGHSTALAVDGAVFRSSLISM
jgi:transposase